MKRFYCPRELLRQSLRNKTFMVTGVSRGLGRKLASQLLKQGAVVHGLSRSKPDIIHDCFHWHSVDLSNLKYVHDFCGEWSTDNMHLDGLINNAAVIPATLSHTQQGMELQWTVNYLSATLMTQQLLPVLKDSHGRVIHISSTAHHSVHGRLGALHFEDIHFKNRTYDKWAAYAQSKLALTIHARQIASAYPKILSVSVHPGWVATTIAPSRLPSWLHKMSAPVLKRKGLCTEWEGIQAILAALLLPKEDIHSGEMLCQVGLYDGVSSHKQHMGWLLPSPNPIVYDPHVSAKLKAYTEQEIMNTLGLYGFASQTK